MKRLLPLLLTLLALPAFAADSGENPVSLPAIAAAGNPQVRRSVRAASGPQGHIVVWEERGAVPTIAIRTYDLEGNPRQPAALTIGPGASPAVTWIGSEFLVVWSDGAVRSAGVAPDGRLLGTSTILGVDAVPPLEVAFNGTDVLLLSGGFVRRVRGGTADLGVGPPNVTIAAIAGGERVTAAGRRSTNGEIVVAPILPNGTSLTPRAIAPSANDLAAAPGVVLWTDFAGLHATFSDPLLQEGPTLLLDSAALLTPPAVTRLADGSVLAAWHNTAGGSPRICTNRFTPGGAGAAACESASPRQQQVALTSQGGSTLLAWIEPGEIDRVRVDVATGGTTPRAHSAAKVASEAAPAQSEPQLTLHDFGALLVWTEFDPAAQRRQIRIGGVAPDGTQLFARTLAPSSNDQHTPRLSAGTHGIYAVWLETVDGDFRLFGARLDRRATLLARNDLGKAAAPAIASRGEDWVVVAQSHRFGEPTASQIRAWEVSAAGPQIVSSIAIHPTADVQLDPDIVWNGASYTVVWREVLGIGANTRQRIRFASLPAVVGVVSAQTVREANRVMSAPSVARNGNTVAAAWREENAGEDEIRAWLLTLTGAPQTASLLLGHAEGPEVLVRPGAGGTFVAAAGTTLHRFALAGMIGTSTLTIPALDLDFGYIGSRLVLIYSRAMLPEEGLGNTTRAFVRAIDGNTRRRSVR